MKFESSKWVECDDPRRPATTVVHDTLAGRLAAVTHYLEPTSPDEGHDPEHVHQLRVATRRADAAVVAFADFLPRRKSKKMRRALKRIRKAIGAARDHDVMASRYSAPRDDIATPAHDWLWSRIVDARRAAHPGVDEVYRRFAAGQFARRAERLKDRVRWRGDEEEPTFAALTSDRLARSAAEFFSAARDRPERAAELHALRIAAKRFRYAIELFASVAPGLRDDIYPAIEQVQEKLGKANDHAVAAERVAAWEKLHAGNGSAPPEGVDKIVKREKKKAAAARQAFLDWWTADQAAALERRFGELMQATVKTAENTESPSARRR